MSAGACDTIIFIVGVIVGMLGIIFTRDADDPPMTVDGVALKEGDRVFVDGGWGQCQFEGVLIREGVEPMFVLWRQWRDGERIIAKQSQVYSSITAFEKANEPLF